MKNKPVFYTEAAYVLGLVIMAFGAAFTELASFGMSMVVAPTYILHVKIAQVLPWFSFGVAEYMVQGMLVLLTVLILRRFRLFYLFSFVTALLYGTLLDAAVGIVAMLPCEAMVLRLLWFAVGSLCCALAVSLFFHTYIAPEAYELIVKELSGAFSLNINRVKMAYDCISTALAVVLSFAFFGFGVFRGVGIGTVVCALFNGMLIGRISQMLERGFEFKNRFELEKFFQR